MGLDDEVLRVAVGAVVSTTKFLLAPSEPAVPGAARASVASLAATSRIVPLFRVRAVVEM